MDEEVKLPLLDEGWIGRYMIMSTFFRSVLREKLARSMWVHVEGGGHGFMIYQ